MSTQYTGCLTLTDYDDNDCGDIELGRIRAVAFVKKTAAVTNPSSDAVWSALVAAKNAVVIRNVRGQSDGGSPVEGPGFGDTPSDLQGFNFTASYVDQNTVPNVDFYNQLKKLAKTYRFWYVTETQIWETGAVPVIIPTIPKTENVADTVVTNVTVKWTKEDQPTPRTKPSTYFDQD